MSEQTRHATPNLLISIHILWLLISSLLHSLSTRLPSPPPSSTLAASPSSPFYLPLFFIFDFPLISVLLFCNFFSSPLPNSRCTLLPQASFCRLLPPLRLPLFFIYLLIFFFNSIPCRRKNPRGLQSRICSFSASSFVEVFTRYVPRRGTFSAPVESRSSFSCVLLLVSRSLCFTITKSHPERRQLARRWYCASEVCVVSHKSLNNSNVASSFPPFFSS